MKYYLILITSILYLNCAHTPKGTTSNSPNLSIIPYPNQIKTDSTYSSIETFSINDKASLALSDFSTWIATWDNYAAASDNKLSVVADDKLDHHYALEVQDTNINITYKNKAGLSAALSTLLQLTTLNKRIPNVTIQDGAQFTYRGMHLDVSRHMYNLDEIKQYLDYLAFYKINYFHWHLTDDQGWRIEIKKFPKLQEVAAYRSETLIGHYNDQPHQFDGKRYGGYYTQDDVREIVAYAMARGIEVIPEIDIPGHSTALISAYPELSCHQTTVKPATKWGVFFDILCPSEETFSFLQNVFDEVITLFPSDYIHIGGDECPKDQWKENPFCQRLMKNNNLDDEMELQSYFIRRVEKYLNSKGKKIIGWDEILKGGLAPNATVMSWRGIEGGIEAAQAGHNVIMTPTSDCYFDYYQSEDPNEPLAIGGYIPISKVYNYNPIPKELDSQFHKYVLGAQGNVWSEYLPTFDKVEYMALARMITLAEVVWGRNSNTEKEFTSSLFQHIQYWKGQGANIANHLLDVNTSISVDPKLGIQVNATSLLHGSNLLYTSEGTFRALQDQPLHLDKAGTYQFCAEKNGVRGNVNTISYKPHLGNRASLTLQHNAADKYAGNGPQSLINGVQGFSDRYGGSEWLGFDGVDLDGTLTFDTPQQVTNVSFTFFNGEGQWIYLPRKVTIAHKGKVIAESTQIASDEKLAKLSLDLPQQQYKDLQIKVENYGMIPDGKQGAGHKAWLFVDEIVVR